MYSCGGDDAFGFILYERGKGVAFSSKLAVEDAVEDTVADTLLDIHNEMNRMNIIVFVICIVVLFYCFE